MDQLEYSASRRRWAQGTTFDTIYGVRIMKYSGTVYDGAEEEDYFYYQISRCLLTVIQEVQTTT